MLHLLDDSNDDVFRKKNLRFVSADWLKHTYYFRGLMLLKRHRKFCRQCRLPRPPIKNSYRHADLQSLLGYVLMLFWQ